MILNLCFATFVHVWLLKGQGCFLFVFFFLMEGTVCLLTRVPHLVLNEAKLHCNHDQNRARAVPPQSSIHLELSAGIPSTCHVIYKLKTGFPDILSLFLYLYFKKRCLFFASGFGEREFVSIIVKEV